ncbi:MAG TPA: 23S rRNA (guanosine(2251)-2'-O)-methyltransferase RlmB [bacterium]|nr:23S rRNA (guanosine(2251)-2'-O)-methyltransferase RlmB [bacterium]
MARRRRRPARPFDIVAGRNSVLAALEAGGRTVATVVVDRNAGGSAIDEIRQKAAAAGVTLNVTSGRELTDLVGGDFHQGVAAYVEKTPTPTWEALMETARAGRPFVVLDHVEDPRNLGSVIRSAAAFGAGAVLFPPRRQVQVTPTVAKVAEGGLEYLPVVPVSNVAQFLRQVKDAGIWRYGLEADGEARMGELEFGAGAAFVFGGEGVGLSLAARNECDAVVSIPRVTEVSSLNVAAAAAITLYEFRRQNPPAETEG